MPDISMCADDDCPSRAECYRNKASGTVPHVPWQAFTDYQRKPDDEQCAAFSDRFWYETSNITPAYTAFCPVYPT